jgi:hypothetical protein
MNFFSYAFAHWVLLVGCHWGLVILTSARIGSRDQGYSPTLTVIGCHWGLVILTSARIGSPGPERYPYSHCGLVPLRPSDSDFSQKWFWLQPELEAQDWGDAPTLTVVGHHWGPVILTSARSDSDFSRNWKPRTGEIPPTLTAVGCHWGLVILTSARIGSPGLRRFPYSHCGWVPLRPSYSDFSQNWKPRTGEIPLLSLWLGTIEAQWCWLQPELEDQDLGDSPTLTAVGCHWGPVIPTSARIGSPGPGRFPYSFHMIPSGLLGKWITGNPHTTHVEIKWSGKTRTT